MLLKGIFDGHVTLTLYCLLAVLDNLEGCFPGNTRIKLRRPKKEPPLIFKEHDPNTHETSPLASGPAEGRISRTDKRFKNLVHNHNPDIIFKDEEMTGEDRIMSKRCKEKLDTLAMLVVNYWPGVRVRVTEAWDEDGYHSPNSLHAEGRAVDITTSDRDKSKYGMLARLARQAGFDWVYYESKAHVHASVKADHALGIKLRGCFPGAASVFTDSGQKTMSSLVVGDRVLALLPDGRLGFQPVLMFLHRNAHALEEFIHLTTACGSTITLTPYHLIYASPSNVSLNSLTDFRNAYVPVFAKDIFVGQFILTTANHCQDHSSSPLLSDSKLVPVKVFSTETVHRRGVYAPLTAADTVVVNDVVASCYASYEHEWLARYLFLPAKLFFQATDRLTSWPRQLMWLAYWKSNTTSVFVETTHGEEYMAGIHIYARLLLWLYQLINHF